MVDFKLGEYIIRIFFQSVTQVAQYSGTVEPPLTAISLKQPLFCCNRQIIHTFTFV